jgi:hypothetical protein
MREDVVVNRSMAEHFVHHTFICRLRLMSE